MRYSVINRAVLFSGTGSNQVPVVEDFAKYFRGSELAVKAGNLRLVARP